MATGTSKFVAGFRSIISQKHSPTSIYRRPRCTSELNVIKKLLAAILSVQLGRNVTIQSIMVGHAGKFPQSHSHLTVHPSFRAPMTEPSGSGMQSMTSDNFLCPLHWRLGKFCGILTRCIVSGAMDKAIPV